MLSQLNVAERKPSQMTITKMTHNMQLRMVTTLDCCMKFNTTDLPTRFPSSLFSRKPFAKTGHWKSLFYEIALDFYYYNLIRLISVFGFRITMIDASRSLFASLSAVNDLLLYMSCGVFANWDKIVNSNKNSRKIRK